MLLSLRKNGLTSLFKRLGFSRFVPNGIPCKWTRMIWICDPVSRQTTGSRAIIATGSQHEVLRSCKIHSTWGPTPDLSALSAGDDLRSLRFVHPAAEGSRAAKRGCFKRGGFPIWTCPSFFVLFGTFPIFLGFSWFARGWSGEFPDLSFSSFSAYQEHLRGTVPKGSATQSGPFPKKVGNTRVWKPPGLASLKRSPAKGVW